LRVTVFYHDKCFDGASSAALFSRFYRERIRGDADFVFTGLVHRAGAHRRKGNSTATRTPSSTFKYSSSPHITWWFDHHEALPLGPTPSSFEEDQSNRKFYDPISILHQFHPMVGSSQGRFGFDPTFRSRSRALDRIIDAPLCRRPRPAVELKAPAMKLTMVTNPAPDHCFVPNFDPAAGHESLAEIPKKPFVPRCFAST